MDVSSEIMPWGKIGAGGGGGGGIELKEEGEIWRNEVKK